MGCGGGFRVSSDLPPQLSSLNTVGGSAGELVLTSYLQEGTGDLLVIADTAYFAYLGRAIRNFTPKFVVANVDVIGAGAQVAEVGFFSTPSSPNKAGQSLSKIVASASVDTLTTLGAKRNTAAFGTLVLSGTYLWAGIRVNMAVTEPRFAPYGRDRGQGALLSQAAAAAFTTAGPWAGALIADASDMCPWMDGELV